MDKKIKPQEMGHFEKYMPLYIIYGISLGLSVSSIIKFIFCYSFCPDYKLFIIGLILWISSVGILMLGINRKKIISETSRNIQSITTWLILITAPIVVIFGSFSSDPSERIWLGIWASITILCMSYFLGKCYGTNISLLFYAIIILFASLSFYIEYIHI